MKKVHGVPITGSTPRTSNKRPFVPDAKDTSADAQVMIAEAPSPFKNRNQAGEASAGMGPKGAVPGPTRKPYAGLEHSSPGAKALPSGGPVGQNRPINQSGQVFGRMGTSHPRHKGAQNLGKAKRHASFYGE